MHKVVAQIRTAGFDRLKIAITGMLYLVETNGNSEIFKRREVENSTHMLVW